MSPEHDDEYVPPEPSRAEGRHRPRRPAPPVPDVPGAEEVPDFVLEAMRKRAKVTLENGGDIWDSEWAVFQQSEAASDRATLLRLLDAAREENARREKRADLARRVLLEKGDAEHFLQLCLMLVMTDAEEAVEIARDALETKP